MATDRHQAPSYPLRMPEELKERVRRAAEDSGRSLHAELIHRLQNSFSDGEDAEQSVGVSIALTDPRDRAAILKVLLLQELMLLRNRVEDLGGRDAVIAAPKADVFKRVTGPRIRGTEEEQRSYFSRVVESLPLQSLLTTQEITHLAQRVVQLQNAHGAPGLLAPAANKRPKGS